MTLVRWPMPQPDPAAASWSNDKTFSDTAVSAVAPAGYSQQITDAHIWTAGDGFLGVAVLEEYDASIGALLCDSLEACSSFQIYFEKEEGSEVVIKVAFWAGAFAAPDSASANALIAGLNGYTNTTLSTPDGFDVPSYVGNQAIRPPSGSNYFLDSKIFHGPFDTASCSKECEILGCNFFNTYIVLKNGVNQGQYCDVYSDAIGHEWATESGSTVGKTNWTISHSFTCTWAGEKRGQDPSSSSASASTTMGVQGAGDKGSWEHHHPWHGSGPRISTSIIGSSTSSTTSKSSSSIHVSETTTKTRWGTGASTQPVHETSSTKPQSSSSSLIDPIGHGSTSSLSSEAVTRSTPGHSWLHDMTIALSSVDPATTSSTTPFVISTTSSLAATTSGHAVNPTYNGSHTWNGTLPNVTHWYDWLYNQSTSALTTTTTSTLPVDPATTTTSSTSTTSIAYPSDFPYNAGHPWNGTLPNGTHWFDWLYNSSSSSVTSTTTSTLDVDPETTTTSSSASSTTTATHPPAPPFNGTHLWNGTLPNGTHWYDWLYNETTSALITTKTTTSTLIVDPLTTTTSSQAYIITSSVYPTVSFNGSLWNGTHWYDWIFNETTSSLTTTTTSTLFIDPETTTTTSAYLTTVTYPATNPWNGTLWNGTHWNGTLPNGTHWYDWLYNETSPLSTTTSTLFVDPATTTTSDYATSTTAYSGYPFNGTFSNHTHWTDWNVTNGTHWQDWLYNDTTSSSVSTTTSTLFVDPTSLTTSTTTYAYITTTSAYPSGIPYNGSFPNGTHWTDWNVTLPNGTHWQDWVHNDTASSSISTTTSPLFVDPVTTTTTTTSAHVTTSAVYPYPTGFNGTFPNNTHWTDWNITLPFNGTLPNGTHWYDWIYNSTTTSETATTTITSLLVDPTETSTTSLYVTTSAYSTYPSYNGSFPNGTHWTDWNITLPGNSTHYWPYNETTTSAAVVETTTTSTVSLTTTTTMSSADPTTTGPAYNAHGNTSFPSFPYNGTQGNSSFPSFPHNGTQGNSSFPSFPSSNASYPSSNSSWAENGCDPTPPSQILKNPSFECSLGGWAIVEGDIVWGGMAAPTIKRKMKKRDTTSPDLASDGKGFARLHPSSSSDIATLSQTLYTAAANGSYWYSFDYRVPASGDTPAECSLTVSDDEGVLQVVSGLDSATEWTKTGNEFKIKEFTSTFSWAFSCNGAETESPILDLDNFRLGGSNGTWAFSNGTFAGPPSNITFGGPPANGNFSFPPANLTYPVVAPPTYNLTAPAVAQPPQNETIPSDEGNDDSTTSTGTSTKQTTTGDETVEPTENDAPAPESGDAPTNGTTTIPPPTRRRFRPRHRNARL
ncbi:hypothetical protein LTR84_004041 [Exophiala bonariae]|uniref:Uncharacterized protein n=1 Tax=Exophiala bonariae TaxID=1690606 RepID=A0AAV9N9T2_9EURO|nr:hypothetical protein LTR84_004041 [Exophiala bonariae]